MGYLFGRKTQLGMSFGFLLEGARGLKSHGKSSTGHLCPNALGALLGVAVVRVTCVCVYQIFVRSFVRSVCLSVCVCCIIIIIMCAGCWGGDEIVLIS